jgi:hypothetical protein
MGRSHNTHAMMTDEYKPLVENLKVRDLYVCGRVMLKLIVKKQAVRVWIELKWIMIGSSIGFFKHSNEPSCSMKVQNFFAADVLYTFQLRTCAIKSIFLKIISCVSFLNERKMIKFVMSFL